MPRFLHVVFARAPPIALVVTIAMLFHEGPIPSGKLFLHDGQRCANITRIAQDFGRGGLRFARRRGPDHIARPRHDVVVVVI